jgi:hypothetical protein
MWIEMAVLHGVIHESCNDDMTHLIKCTNGWGISLWEYPKFWTWKYLKNASIIDTYNDKFIEGVSEKLDQRNI